MFPASVSLLSADAFSRGENRSPTQLVRLFVCYTLHHGPSDTAISVAVVGEGADVQDKSCNRAMTAAEKVALRQAFLLASGDDDPDNHASEPLTDFAPGKGEPPAKFDAAIKAIKEAATQERLDTLMESARTRQWTQEQYDLIRAEANIKFDTFAAF